MKVGIVSGLTIATLSAMPVQALNFGTGNAYDRYWAGESVSIQGTDIKAPDTKLLPDRPILQPIQVPETEVMQPITVQIPENRVIAKYGVPYPIIKPEKPSIIELKYGVPYPREDNLIGPGRFNAPMTKYGINLPK